VPVETFDDVQRYVSVRPGVAITITMDRDGTPVDLTLTPVRTEISDNFGNKMEVGRIGVITSDRCRQFQGARIRSAGSRR
jgi:regulator of sigma E protease